MSAPVDTQATLLPLRQMLLRGLCVLLAVAVVLALALGWRMFDTTSTEARTAAAIDAARTRTAQVLSLDASALDADLADARRQVTGDFAARFAEVVESLILPARDQAISTRAEVVRAAVVTSEPGRVQALLYVNQLTASAAEPEPRLSTTQVTVTMTLVDRQWLISQLTLV